MAIADPNPVETSVCSLHTATCHAPCSACAYMIDDCMGQVHNGAATVFDIPVCSGQWRIQKLLQWGLIPLPSSLSLVFPSLCAPLST